MLVNSGQHNLSIVIVSWNVREHLVACLQSVISQTARIHTEVIVVDNASSDGTAALVRAEFPAVKLIENRVNLGFAKACNQGIKISSGRLILLLNPDTRLLCDIAPILEFYDTKSDAGVVGCQLIGADGRNCISFQGYPTVLRVFSYISGLSEYKESIIAHFLIRVISLVLPQHVLHLHQIKTIQEVDAVCGAFFLVSRDRINKLGMLDERFFVYFEETDFCLRCKRAGYRNYFYPHYQVKHYEGQSAAKTKFSFYALYISSLMKFFSKNYSKVTNISAICVLMISLIVRLCAIFLFDFSLNRGDRLTVFSRILFKLMKKTARTKPPLIAPHSL